MPSLSLLAFATDNDDDMRRSPFPRRSAGRGGTVRHSGANGQREEREREGAIAGAMTATDVINV